MRLIHSLSCDRTYRIQLTLLCKYLWSILSITANKQETRAMIQEAGGKVRQSLQTFTLRTCLLLSMDLLLYMGDHSFCCDVHLAVGCLRAIVIKVLVVGFCSIFLATTAVFAVSQKPTVHKLDFTAIGNSAVV